MTLSVKFPKNTNSLKGGALMNIRSDLLNQFKEWNDFVLGITDLDWKTPISDGKWAIHDVVSHIMLWDKYFYETTIGPIARDESITLSLMDFDLFNKNAIEYGKTKTKDELIELTLKYRNLILDCISGLGEVDYSKEYVDGRFTFESYLRDFILHDQHHMMQIKEIKGGSRYMQEIIEYYEGYDEDGRLTRDNYHRTEFLLTLRFLEPYMIPGSRILDAGAGTGRYSFHYAEEGHQLTSLDLTPKHIKLIQEKAMNQNLESKITAHLGNVMDMKDFEDDSFDVVLCMGPFYHLSSLEEWTICMRECLRVLKPGGTIANALACYSSNTNTPAIC